jgi:hypothetical protein
MFVLTSEILDAKAFACGWLDCFTATAFKQVRAGAHQQCLIGQVEAIGDDKVRVNHQSLS